MTAFSYASITRSTTPKFYPGDIVIEARFHRPMRPGASPRNIDIAASLGVVQSTDLDQAGRFSYVVQSWMGTLFGLPIQRDEASNDTIVANEDELRLVMHGKFFRYIQGHGPNFKNWREELDFLVEHGAANVVPYWTPGVATDTWNPLVRNLWTPARIEQALTEGDIDGYVGLTAYKVDFPLTGDRIRVDALQEITSLVPLSQ